MLTNLSKRGINTAGCCTRCKQEPETLIHALVECPAASLIWQHSAFGQQVSNWWGMTGSDLLSKVESTFSRGEIEIFCMVLWMCWCDRNRMVHGDRPGEAKQLVEKAGFILFEFQAASKMPEVYKSQDSQIQNSGKWKPPPQSQQKLNVDASVVTGMPQIGVGGVIRDAHGEVLGAFTKQVQGIFEPLMAELIAIRTGLMFARDIGIMSHVIESDCIGAVQAIQTGSTSGELGVIIEDIRHMQLVGIGGTCHFAPRQCNVVAHALAKQGMSAVDNLSWVEDFPSALSAFVNADKANIVTS